MGSLPPKGLRVCALAAEVRTLRSSTIKDVAQLAGVSIKTVSRVLNREPYVRETLRQRVWETMEQLDYEPHPAARSLGGQRTYSISLIFENPHPYSYVKRLIDGAFEACEARRYILLLQPVQVGMTAREVKKYVRQTRVDGVLLSAPMSDQVEITDTLRELEVPFGQLSPLVVNEGWMSVCPDDEGACRELMTQIHALGHRRVGFIKGHTAHGATHRRLQGYLKAVEELQLDADPTLVVEGAFDFESGHAGAIQLLKLNSRPTAIVASSDDMANGAIVAAHQRGLKLPNDISVVGFDDSPIAVQTYPAITTMRQPIYDMATTLTNMLLDHVHGLDTNNPVREYTCEFIQRDSLAAPA